MRAGILAVFFILVAVPPPTLAKDLACSPTADLSKTLGPNFDQGNDLNSCYANTAADQLTLKMQNEGELGKAERVQPLALWALYTIDDGRSPDSSKGTPSTLSNLYGSLNKLRERGKGKLCKESEFVGGVGTSNPLFTTASVAAMVKVRDQLRSPSSGPCGLDDSTVDRLSKEGKEIEHAANLAWWNEIKTKCQTQIPGISWHYLWRDDRSPFVQKNQSVRWPAASNESLATQIDGALDQGNLAGIEYQASFLLAGKKAFVHWSNIVQRKPEGGKCMYRIRDSFGGGCARYKNPRNCDHGNIWVERQDLLNHTDAVTSLDPAPTT